MSPSTPLEKRVTFETVGQRLFNLDSDPVRLGRFVVLGTLGRGGMGTVLRAYDHTLDRPIAIKLLHSSTSERHATRLRREAQALARLSHPNVVHVYEVGRADDRWFIAMELVTGQTLRKWHGERHGWRECIELYLQAGAGLAAAHTAGLVHRDFKPDNCIIDEGGRPVVLDFGLARSLSEHLEVAPSEDSASDLETSVTRSGALMGTLGYMPLEQLDGRPADAHSDQFSFCVSLYEALYGERPFEGRSAEQVAAAQSEGRIRPAPRGTTVPAGVRRVLSRGLSCAPQDRWPSMEVLLGELRRYVVPRSRRWLGLGLGGVGLAIAGAGLWSYAEVGFRCDGASAELRGAWDDERRDALEQAMLRSGLSYAPDTWLRVAERLDDYAEAWASAHEEICEATSIRQEQSPEVMDLRMGCLALRRVALRESVDVLIDVSETRVEHAARVVANLPPLSRCDDVEGLRASVLSPEDPAVRSQVEDERARLRQAIALDQAGEYSRSSTIADAVVVRARALDFPPLLAEALLRRGRSRLRKGHYPESERDLERAYVLATEQGHHAVQAKAAASLVRAAGAQRDRADHSLWWAQTALAMARGPHVEPSAEGSALFALGVAHRHRGDFEAARDRLQQALEARRRALGPTHPDVAGTLNELGLALRERGRLDEALASYRQALEIRRDVSGPEHPETAIALHNIATVLRTQGKLDDARDAFEQALRIEQTALGPEHPHVATTLTSLGTLRYDRGEYDEALSYYRRALTIAQAQDPEHPATAVQLNNIGNVLMRQGKLDEALETFKRALAIRETAHGPEHPEVAGPINNIAIVLKKQGKLDEALPYYQRTLAVSEQTLGPEHFKFAMRLYNTGNLLVLLGELDDAQRHDERAVAILEKALGPEHLYLAYPLSALAEIALRRGQWSESIALCERALSLCEASEAPPAPLLPEIRFRLARASWREPAKRARARELARAAREGFAGLDGAQAQLAEVDAWLAERSGGPG